MSTTLPSPTPHAPAVDAPIPPAVPSPSDPAPAPVEMFVTLENVDWDLYEAIDRTRGDRACPRLIYSDGRLTLVSPSLRHDHSEEALGLFVMTVCEELDLPCTGAGSTTFCRKDWKLGVEGDRTYYLANEPRIREKAARGEDIDLASGDPPPDLALEIELTHPAIEALAIWQAFGTPEVWVYRPRTLTLAFFLLAEDGEYRESARSRAFPFLSASEIVDWITRSVEEPMSRWNRRLRAWVNEVLVPRTKGVDAGDSPKP